MSYAGISKRESFWGNGVILRARRRSRLLYRAERMRIFLRSGRLSSRLIFGLIQFVSFSDILCSDTKMVAFVSGIPEQRQ